MKWKDSKREGSISITSIKGLTRDMTGGWLSQFSVHYWPWTICFCGTENDADKWVPTAVFECRGLEPYAFHPEGDWEVESTGGTKFSDVDLQESEWTDYCEKLGESVGIYKVQGKFEQHRDRWGVLIVFFARKDWFDIYPRIPTSTERQAQ